MIFATVDDPTPRPAAERALGVLKKNGSFICLLESILPSPKPDDGRKWAFMLTDSTKAADLCAILQMVQKGQVGRLSSCGGGGGGGGSLSFAHHAHMRCLIGQHVQLRLPDRSRQYCTRTRRSISLPRAGQRLLPSATAGALKASLSWRCPPRGLVRLPGFPLRKVPPCKPGRISARWA